MPTKDPLNYSLLTYFWVVFIAAWGGVVSFVQKVRSGKARSYNIVEFIGEITTSAFVGVITFWLCESAAISPLLSAAMVGVSAHMGSRALFHLETMIEKRVNKVLDVE